jgi:GT2 family glycosyltransferase
VIPTWRRTVSLCRALEQILACRPAPAEVLVHVDAGDGETRGALQSRFGHAVRWFSSDTTQGPGGGRNQLIREARSPIVASFDDDSWPMDADYFAVAAESFDAHPRAAVLDAREIRPNSEENAVATAPETEIARIACYQNCASLIRRDAFLTTRGYLPLRYAYGMEEADVALQLMDAGWELLHAPALRVFHDTSLEHHGGSAVNAAHICNTALLAYLRYPICYWPLAALQVLNRARFAARMGRWPGIATGFCQIPAALWRNRNERKPVSAATIALSRSLARGDALTARCSVKASTNCAVETSDCPAECR